MAPKRMPEMPRLNCKQTKVGSADAVCSVLEGMAGSGVMCKLKGTLTNAGDGKTGRRT